MLALYCPRHGHAVLLDIDRITRMVNIEDGLIVVEAECYDGTRIQMITGSRAVLPPDEVGTLP